MFWLWDAVGLAWSVEQMKTMGIEPSKNLLALLDKQGAEATWFTTDGPSTKQWIGEKSAYVEIEPPAGMIILDRTKASPGAIIEGNDQASLIDLGDGVACVEFHSKMNSLNAKVVSVLSDALDSLSSRGDFRGLVIGNQAGHFSAGADLFGVLAMAGQGKWDDLNTMVNEFQQTSMKIPTAPFPWSPRRTTWHSAGAASSRCTPRRLWPTRSCTWAWWRPASVCFPRAVGSRRSAVVPASGPARTPTATPTRSCVVDFWPRHKRRWRRQHSRLRTLGICAPPTASCSTATG
ncbi:MAG: hypothetical protein JKY37_06020 [Nannocystaceae bacterium]|nr:hypothetical protein [Nannocystaceae bacterium]